MKISPKAKSILFCLVIEVLLPAALLAGGFYFLSQSDGEKFDPSSQKIISRFVGFYSVVLIIFFIRGFIRLMNKI